MVKQTETKLVREIDKLSENESLAVLDYISRLLTSRTPKPNENFYNDDLIASLAEQRENRRACQVIEWEKTRRRNNSQKAA